MDALESLPDELDEVSDCLQRFRQAVDDRTWGRLRDKAVRLYITILAAIEGILVWLDEKAVSK